MTEYTLNPLGYAICLRTLLVRQVGGRRAFDRNRDIMLSAAELANDGEMSEELRSYFDRRESELRKIFD